MEKKTKAKSDQSSEHESSVEPTVKADNMDIQDDCPKAPEAPIDPPILPEENLSVNLPESVNVEVKKEDETTEPTVPKPEKKKRKKSKKVQKDKDFPKFYKNGYVRFCDYFRPRVCEENPAMDPVEITKAVASKWYSLTKDEKQKYLDEGKQDKDRFEKEVKEYKKHHPEAEATSVEPPKKSKPAITQPSNGHTPRIETTTTTKVEVLKHHDDVPKAYVGLNCELPIFTDEFLNHNKEVESELKLLRKKNLDIDQQNSVLMKHVENMQNGVQKVDSEIAVMKEQNVHLEEYLTKMKCVLASGLHSLTLPALKSGASIENIDKYMQELASAGTAPATTSKASDIIRKMNLKFVA